MWTCIGKRSTNRPGWSILLNWTRCHIRWPRYIFGWKSGVWNPNPAFLGTRTGGRSQITGVLTRLLVSELSCLCIDGLVHKSLECITMMQVEITTQLGVETLPEPSLLLGVRGHFFCGIAGEVLKLSAVSINSHLILGETTELFSLAINEGLGNVMLAKSLSEIPPGRNLASWKHSLIVLPPKTSRTFQVVCGIGDLVIFSYARGTQLMSDATEPVICIEWLDGMMKGRWVQANEIMNGSRPFELMCGVLLDTCQQTIRFTLVPLHL